MGRTPNEDDLEGYLDNMFAGLTKDELAKPINTMDEKYKLIPMYIKTKGLTKQHIDSYNYFIEQDLKKILDGNRLITSDVNPQWFFEYTNIYIRPFKLDHRHVTPQECRLRDLNYSAPIYVDVRYVRGNSMVEKQAVPLGNMPIMLRSSICILDKKSDTELTQLNECIYDSGGYFIVRGVEKVILSQEQLSKNRIIVETDKKGGICGTVASSTHERKSKTSIVTKHRCFYLHHNSLSDDIPICIVLKAMGIGSDQRIVQMVGSQYNEHMIPSIDECARLEIFTQQQALSFIGSKIRHARLRLASSVRNKSRIDTARDNIASVIFSHVPVINYDFTQKMAYTCLILRRMCQAIDNPKLIDDRDYYGNKRLELAGQLLALLFEDLLKRLNAELKRQADFAYSKQNRAEAFDALRHFDAGTITHGLANAISTGNWNVKRFKMERAGVTQVLSRLSFIAALGMMTRVTSQFEKTRKVSGPRSLQGSQWGVLCPSDTPEGEACGLVKNLALLSHVTSDIDEPPIREWCYSLGVGDITLYNGEESAHRSTFIVMLNGTILGNHNNPTQFASNFRKLRRHGYLHHFVSIYVNEEQRIIYISSDGGRLCRPLIVVENGKVMLTPHHITMILNRVYTFADLVKQGVLEYLDVNEQNNTLITLTLEDIGPRTTHMEIDPMTVLGVVAGLIPYPHHNQSPRNTYQCAMGKQAMGTIAYNQYNRIDTLLYLLVYPQRPLTQSHTIEMIGFDKLPAGQNATVFVMSYSGYDIEDASILNKAGIDRGFGRCMVLRKNVVTLKQYPNQTQDQIVVPNELVGRYKSLDQDGICRVGLPLENGDMLVNKMVPTETNELISNLSQRSLADYTPQPASYKGPETAYVDQVLLTSNDSEYLTIKVLLRSTRQPELGDKFSSRHGQKGVCGLIVQQEDMPFTDQGVYPDLVMNPHGFPSRMTVGKLLELVASKNGALNGRFAYGTAFGGDKIEDISRGLISAGFAPSGKEILNCGMTGEPLSGLIFTGPVYYQKLKHMVMDKMHARSRGPRAILTRQPTEGRSRDGGLRLGEMERDCLIGYGAASVVTERLLLSADKFSIQVCLSCGLMQYSDICSSCPSGVDHIAKTASLTLPYACKLLFQELQAMNILPRLRLETL